MPKSIAVRNCRRKAAFKTEQRARIVAWGRGYDYNTYQCEICSKWHLTKKPTRETELGSAWKGIPRG
jgi:hypothetical protein